MKFDLFCSLCQGSMSEDLPKEKTIFQNFLSQAELADNLDFETLWLAESHLSSEVQKKNKKPVIPHFRGEVGLNTDLLQLSHLIYSRTKKINLGTAVRNILCNGGPLAHAEAIRYHLFLEELHDRKQRNLNLGFASGRFEFSNKPYFIRPRDSFEEIYWSQIKSKVLYEASQIFLKGLKGEAFSSSEIKSPSLSKQEFSNEEEWEKAQKIAKKIRSYEIHEEKIRLKKFWEFEETKVIPNDVSLENLELYLGSHSSEIQELVSQLHPCKVFNLSITSKETIDQTHERMTKAFKSHKLQWKREFMPRTALIFVNGDKGLSSKEQSSRAKKHADSALKAYWNAIEGTINPDRIKAATNNSLCGNPEEVLEQMEERFHPEDRLMLWFDFNCHDNTTVTNSMKTFMEQVAPNLGGF